MSEGKITDTEQRLHDKKDVADPQDPPWMNAFGELRDLREETRRIQKIIDQEFGKIDEEDWR